MNAVSIGPFVFDASRLAAVAAIGLFLAVSAIAVRLGRQRGQGRTVEAWAGWAVLAWILGARLGFVLTNADDFAGAPLDALKLWQGGFSARAGWAAAGATLAAALLTGRGAVLRPLLIAAAVTAVAHQAVTAALPRPQMQLPAMELLALDGSPVQLAGRDKVTVVNLWATWCPPCRREMPMMTNMAAGMPDVDFVFANQGESADRVFAFLAAENLPLTGMLRDPRGYLMGRLRAVGLPSTLVFDRTGTLVAAQTGEISAPALRTMIETARK
ncbi:TlpA family protein disulfide reductase [Paracoccus subflavus]|uniref:TlpA family protein disulfide reductase n=1 Tax=Paracoccus subflavus TaxID=2528244 RepID=A0A4Q9G2P5_9RHOB|nr:TlpA disulfide reductase family protein [Paracoccus subflavus]TBN37520.1 TlpA family protein disulfide reductase [Paracoccus subflavus]